VLRSSWFGVGVSQKIPLVAVIPGVVLVDVCSTALH